MKQRCSLLVTLSLLTLMLAPVASAQEAQRLPSDERLRKAWSFLLPEEQLEIGEWYRSEVGYLDTFQNKMIAYVVGAEERDRGTWPAAEPLPYFDPELHCPAQPIRRTRLAVDSGRAEAARSRLKPSEGSDPLRRTWVYDWASGEIVTLTNENDPEVLFENALLGLPPLIDLAEALLLRRLDDGSQRVALAAFQHAYTDRSGNIYPGVSLYDAWSSGKEFEMPDVDTLGILHTVYDDWRSFKAPVPGSKQEKLYDKIGEAFIDAKRHRGLREAIAVNYLRGSAIPADDYSGTGLAFNALWEECSGVPEAFAEDLPKVKRWKNYLEGLVRKTKKKKFRTAGKNRIAWIDAERFRVKATLVRVLKEFGAMDRKKRPTPAPSEKDTDK